MEIQRRTVWLINLLIIMFFMAGCGKQVRKEIPSQIKPDITIGSITEVFAVQSIPVEGYGLVAGLQGTGSAECPIQVRKYLRRYILTQVPEGNIDVEKLLKSRNTAVVRVHGSMPTAVSKNQRFDVMISALAGTQTTSLKGGWLYSTELKRVHTLGLVTRILATAKGPAFIDTIDPSQANERSGYVLGGGRVRDSYKITLALRQPNYIIARQISDVLNAHFGDKTARATSSEIIEVTVPAEFAGQKQRFISLAKAMSIVSSPAITKKRISKLVRKLATSQDKQASEIALEAIGNACVSKLAALLNSSNEQVRLRAARCMLRLGSSGGFEPLSKIAFDKGSAYRIEALEAITEGTSRTNAASISRRLLRDDNFDVRFAAYKQLRKLDDITISQQFIGDKFFLEQIAQAPRKEIYVSRSGPPRIVLFGTPIRCRENFFVQSADHSITMDVPADQKYVSLIRKLPNQPRLMKLKSSFQLSDIIRTLCQEPVLKNDSTLQDGLNVSYAEVIALLKQMCDKGMVEADFRAGPLPKID